MYRRKATLPCHLFNCVPQECNAALPRVQVFTAGRQHSPANCSNVYVPQESNTALPRGDSTGVLPEVGVRSAPLVFPLPAPLVFPLLGDLKSTERGFRTRTPLYTTQILKTLKYLEYSVQQNSTTKIVKLLLEYLTEKYL